GGVELQQRRLQQPELRRDLAVGEHLEAARHERNGLVDWHALDAHAAIGRPTAAAARAARGGHEVLVGDELVAVALHDHAGELPSAHDEDLLVVLLELLHQADEVAVAADDHEGIDVGMREGHFERVEGQIDVRAILVAAWRQVALHHLDGVLREAAAVAAGALPVAVCGLRDHVAAFLEGFEDEAHVERGAQGVLDANLDVVEIDEYSYSKAIVPSHTVLSEGSTSRPPAIRTDVPHWFAAPASATCRVVLVNPPGPTAVPASESEIPVRV